MARRLNGWQRIWIVLSVLLLLTMLWNGWGDFAKGQSFYDDRYRSGMKELANPACREIAGGTWRAEWGELPYSHPCYTIGIERKYLGGHQPVTPESFTASHTREYWQGLGLMLAMFGGMAVTASLLTYALAWIGVKTFRWVRAGFAREKS